MWHRLDARTLPGGKFAPLAGGFGAPRRAATLAVPNAIRIVRFIDRDGEVIERASCYSAAGTASEWASSVSSATPVTPVTQYRRRREASVSLRFHWRHFVVRLFLSSFLFFPISPWQMLYLPFLWVKNIIGKKRQRFFFFNNKSPIKNLSKGSTNETEWRGHSKMIKKNK